MPPVLEVNLRGCEVTPEVNLSQGKYGIKLEVPSPDGMSEMWIRCDSVSLSLDFLRFLLDLVGFIRFSEKFKNFDAAVFGIPN